MSYFAFFHIVIKSATQNVMRDVIDANKQVGCGAGNTIFPLIATYPNVFVHACDFSPRAVDLIKVWFIVP